MPYRFLDKILAVLNPQQYKEESRYVNELVAEFKNKRSNYEEFRVSLLRVLEAILKEEKLKYQISSRIKSLESLREKLIRKSKAGIRYDFLTEIEDLVGLRVILYTQKDKEKFIKRLENEISGLLRVEEREKSSGYRSTHIIMSFGPKRLKLSEFKHLKGLKGEIQVTSILHHAWAEIEHDLIYKDSNNLRERYPEKFEELQNKMNILLKKHIEVVSTELEKIISDNDL